MSDLQSRCEQSLYQEICPAEGTGKTEAYIVRDIVSGQLFLRKTLSVYNRAVFEYLKTHRNLHIPAVHQLFEENGKLTVIEEIVQGETLAYILQNKNPSREEKLRILEGVCDGLAFLHKANPPIVHRDIKESNIMVTGDGTVKVIDFDAARNIESGASNDTELFGTHGNAAPEQYGFAQSDARTDIYSVGVLIKRMFPDDPSMQKVANKATKMDPKDRYQTAGQLQKAIHACSQNEVKKKSTGLAILIAVIAVAVCVGILVLILGNAKGGCGGTAVHSKRESAAIASSSSAREIVTTAEETTTFPWPEEYATYPGENVKLDEVNYVAHSVGDSCMVEVAGKVYNPNSDLVAYRPVVRLISRDKDGNVLAYEEITLGLVMPNETAYFASYVSMACKDTDPIDIFVTEDTAFKKPNDKMQKPSDFTVAHTSEKENFLGGKEYLGEITNNSSQNASAVEVVVIRKNKGRIVGGNSVLMYGVEAGSTKLFDIMDVGATNDYDSYEFYVTTF